MRLHAKSGLLASCGLGALLVAFSHNAAAQSFQGSPSVVAGEASISTSAGGSGVLPSTTIDLSTSETVINWTIEDISGVGTIDFQPADTVATFNGDDLADFTVLNRILPTDGNGAPLASTVSFNGTVESFVNPVGGPSTPGGQVWFYSPAGIIVGPSAVFNVGSLILTTNDIPFVANDPDTGLGGYIRAAGGLVQFAGPADSTGFVDVQAGAQINAVGNPFGSSAYVALVAPRVVQSGRVTADGNVAYIAAEQVDMTIDAGLVDFTVTVGTTDENGVVHEGITTGPASMGAADSRRISMVALPKNDALTMLLSGSIGYAPAAVAENDGSSVVLSAGFATAEPAALPANRLGSIDIGAATFTNDVIGYATDNITVTPVIGTTAFEGNAFLNAAQSIDVTADIQQEVTVGGDLYLTAGAAGTGGDITISSHNSGSLPGGRIVVTGWLGANASSDGIVAPPTALLDGQGGSVHILADGGLVSAAQIYASADGYGGTDSVAGGDGRGGLVDASVINGGTIAAGAVSLDAGGYGGTSEGTGGNGFGGSVSLSDSGGGTLDLVDVFLSARAFGGSGFDAGDGDGGEAHVSITSQAQSWNSLFIDTSTYAGGSMFPDGLAGNVIDGGEGTLDISGPGQLNLADRLDLVADAYSILNGPAGAFGQAGEASITVTAGGALVAGIIDVEASARLTEGSDFEPAFSPMQTGGTASITANGGTITATQLVARAEAYGASAQTAAGIATGGTVTVSALGGGAITIDDDLGTSEALLSADAFGATGPAPSDSIGGTARIIVEDATFGVNGDILLTASGVGGEVFYPPTAGDGFNATGGTASIELREGLLGTAELSANSAFISAVADARLFATTGTLPPGGDPIPGDGGTATGGASSLLLEAGQFNADALTLDSSAIGGGSGASSGAAAFQSGDGSGGTSRFTISGGTANLAALDLVSNGTGGEGTSGPAATGVELAALAGDGTGGNALLLLNGGTLTVTDTTLQADGFGAGGMNHLANGNGTGGGMGSGGTASVSSPDAWAGYYSTGTLTLQANGQGGLGGTSGAGIDGNGGVGAGGLASVELADGEFGLGTVSIVANAYGGGGALGGEASGGDAGFTLVDSATGPSGPREILGLDIDSSATGGVGSDGVTALSSTGSAAFTFDVLGAASAVSFSGPLTVRSTAVTFTPGSGIHGLVAGAALDIGGNLVLSTTGPIVITANEQLHTAGSAVIAGASFTSTGVIASDLLMDVIGTFGIDADQLRSGGSTSLTASDGQVAVAGLLSAGDVTAFGQSIDIASSGALSFADLDATAGPLSVSTTGNLAVSTVDGSGTVTLRSANGSVASSGAVNAGGNAAVEGGAGVFLPVLNSGGTTLLASANGNVDIDLLTSAGTVSVGGVNVDLDGTGALTFAAAQADGVMSIVTGGNLSFAAVSAGSALDLASTGGSLSVAGNIAGGSTGLQAAGDIVLNGALAVDGALVAVAGGGVTVLGGTTADSAAVTAGGEIAFALLDSGGATSLSATNGPVTVADMLSVGDVAVRGQSIDIASSGALTFSELEATSGPLSVQTAGNLSVAAVDGTGPVTLRSTGGSLSATGEINGGATTLFAAGGITLETDLTVEGLFVAQAGGSVTALGATRADGIDVTAGGGISFDELASGGTTTLNAAAGSIEIGALTSPGPVSAMAGGDVDINSEGPLTFTAAQAGGALNVIAAGDLAFASARSGSDLHLQSVNGGITATGNVVSGGDARLAAAGSVQLSGNLDAEGGLVVDTDGRFAVAGNAAIGGGSISADQGIAFGSAASSGPVSLVSANGSIVIPSLQSSGMISASATEVDIASTGSLQFGSVEATGGDATIGTGGDLAIDRVFASQTVALNSGGTFSLGGGAVGRVVLVTSGDIAIDGGEGFIGQRGFTESISLTSGDAQRAMFVGGGSRSGGYSLNEDEVSRLFADNLIRIGDLDGAGGGITIDDFALSFGASGNIGSGGTLEISSPAEIRVIGDVALTTSGSGDTFLIDPTFIGIDTSTGSIAMLDANGVATGRLELTGDTVAVATSAVLERLRTATGIDAIGALLGQPGGTAEPLRAGTVAISVSNGLYVQNTGSSTQFADRRGITANAVEIETATPGTQIAINGQILTASGAVTGLDAIPLVTINGEPAGAGGQFDPGSTINGCVIGTSCTLEPQPTYQPPASYELVPVDLAGQGSSLIVAPVIELADTKPLIEPPLVDEPITGVGNDDLWEPRCEAGDGGDSCRGGDE